MTNSGLDLLLQRKRICGGSANVSSDPMEREADQVADQVVAGSVHPTRGKALPIQRYTGRPTGVVGTAPASVERALASAGRSLDVAVQQDMGQRFGHDFSRVRVHTGALAEQSARDVNAEAYTTGSNIVFGAGHFSPGSSAGRRLLAHELTHVVQQAGTVGTPVMQRQEAQTTPEPEQKETKNKLKLQLTEPDFLGLRKPFFDRNAYQLWDSDSALGVWQYNVDFFKGFGITENWARKAANLTAPFSIDSQLKAGNPKWWEITDRELETTSFVGSVPLFSFDANFRQWKPLPFLEF